MLNAISLVIGTTKNEFDRIAKVQFSPPPIFMPCDSDINFRTPDRIYFDLEKPVSEYSCRWGDIASTQTPLNQF
jgi:hypothetical protein